MKNLREQFLPFNYTQKMFQRLHTFQQHVARYISGLHQSIQDVLSLYFLWTVSEAYQRALTVEKQQSRSRAIAATRGDSDAPSGGRRDIIAAPINHQNTASLGARVQGSISTLHCFKCGEMSHKAKDCKKSNSQFDKNKQVIIVDENLDDANWYDGDPIYDDEPYEDDLVYGDVGESLIIRKSLLTPKQ
ncbi:hypothetical protein AMTRI_Chr13g122910 [Amborella trichopoda]